MKKKNQSLVSGNRLCRDSAATPSSSAPISNRGRVHVLTALTKTWMKTIQQYTRGRSFGYNNGPKSHSTSMMVISDIESVKCIYVK